MASKFWAASSSEEDSDEECVLTEEATSTDVGSSSDSGSSIGSSSTASSRKRGASRFLLGSSDSESEDERRVVRSAKEKAREELCFTCNDIKNKMHINDWAAIQTLFDKLNKQLERTQKVTQSVGVPRAYIRMLCELEDFLNKTLAEKPKLSPTNTRALTRMKQTLRKHNAAYIEQLQSFRDNPETELEDEEGSPREGSTSDESDLEHVLNSEDEEEAKFKTVRSGVAQRAKDKLMSMDPKEITYEMVQEKLQEIALARGKTTRIDRREQIEMLTYLSGVSKGPVQRLEVMINIITVTFDMNQPTQSTMSVPNWNRCAQIMFDVLALLDGNRHVRLTDIPPEQERLEEPEPGTPTQVWGNLGAFLERLDDEWNGNLKALDPHAHEYMDRMKDEAVILALAQKVSEYLEFQNEVDKLATVALRRLQHFYYKTDVVNSAMRKLALQWQQDFSTPVATNPSQLAFGVVDADEAEGATSLIMVKIPPDFSIPEKCADLVEQLAQVVYAHGNDNQKGQAMLCTVYFRCIHDDFYGARDTLLMSRIQEQTAQLDAKMQVLYNRTIAQLGSCAFRAGLIADCHQCLMDLYGSGRIKELLAQGIQQHRFQEKTPEQEAAERRRQVPFHMHINLELLESMYLISAMLLEVPAMAVQSADIRKRMISKPLRRLMDNYERQSFTGPPENVRDHVMAAVRALATGDWRRSYLYVTKLSCWNLLPQKDAVLGMLRQKLQEDGLRAYLLAYGRFYSSLSIAQLCNMFELPERKVHAVVSRLIADDGLPASHDQPTGTIVVHHVEPTRLQTLAGSFSDKASLLVDLNERALAMRTGVLHTDEDEGEGRRGQDGAQGGRRTRLGSRFNGMGGFGRGGRAGRGGRYGERDRGSGFMPDSGFGGGVFGRGRGRRPAAHRDDRTFTQLGGGLLRQRQ